MASVVRKACNRYQSDPEGIESLKSSLNKYFCLKPEFSVNISLFCCVFLFFGSSVLSFLQITLSTDFILASSSNWAFTSFTDA